VTSSWSFILQLFFNVLTKVGTRIYSSSDYNTLYYPQPVYASPLQHSILSPASLCQSVTTLYTIASQFMPVRYNTLYYPQPVYASPLQHSILSPASLCQSVTTLCMISRQAYFIAFQYSTIFLSRFFSLRFLNQNYCLFIPSMLLVLPTSDFCIQSF